MTEAPVAIGPFLPEALFLPAIELAKRIFGWYFTDDLRL
jgi:hypothetical protein